MTDPKINSILDEGNRLFLEGKFQQARFQNLIN
jgi:hypothetical protein